MIESPARVVRASADQAWVVSEAPTSCGACGGRGCGSSMYARMLHPKESEFAVDNPIGAQPGEAVIVGLPDGALLSAAWASYLLPLILILVGAALGQSIGGELISALGALTGLGLASIWLKLRRVPAHAGPVILRRGEPAGCHAH